MNIPTEAIEAATQVLDDSEVMHCTRVWSAWAYGTMSEDDFVPASEEPTLIPAVLTAALPALEQQIRRRVAEEIRTTIENGPDIGEWEERFELGMRYAAQIVLGEHL